MVNKYKTSNRVKVLLIEDSPSDIRLIQEVLKDKPKIKGYKLITAETGEEGVKRANLEKPDLIMIDTLLPGIDGFQACRQIRKIKGFSPKIIVYTGIIDAVDAEKAKLAGADDYVVKTADFSALIEAMENLFNKIR